MGESFEDRLKLYKKIYDLERRVQDLETKEQGTISLLTLSRGAYTISGGAVTINTSIVVLTPQGGVADNLDTINTPSAGRIIILLNAIGTAITVRDGVGNLLLAGNFVMDSIRDTMVLYSADNFWYELARSNNA